MTRSFVIRHQLLTVLLLGALTSALSLAALVHLLTTSTAQRVERARDAVHEAVTQLAAHPDEHGYAPASVIGMRGGFLPDDAAATATALANVPSEFRAPLLAAVAGAGSVSTIEAQDAKGTLVLSAQPVSGRGHAWAGFLVRPLPSIAVWQRIVVLLALAMVLLVAASVHAIITMNRGASELRQTLAALADDLGTPIPRSPIGELSAIADGIANLASNLASARERERRLGQELTQNERLAALGRVVAGVAHEVRNPLASIKLRLDLAAKAEHLPKSVEQAIAHSSSEISRLDRLVADLLLVAGRASGPRKAVQLGELTAARADALLPWSQARAVSIRCAGDARVIADNDSLSRAIDNLLRNAVEAAPAGSAVVARVDAQDQGARLIIEDQGSGVSPERATELFEPFFTTKPDGTGLGLAISRAIARAHGGDLTYGRNDDKTRFELLLPSAPRTALAEVA